MGSVAGTDARVTLAKCRDHNDTLMNKTECAEANDEDIRDYIYDIKVPRLIGKPSATSIQVINYATDSWIEVRLPTDTLRLSQAPLSGTYIIKCYELDGYERYTSPIPISWDYRNVYSAISNACPNLRGRFSVTHNEDVGCKFNSDCIVWDLKFYSVYGALNQFEILSNEGYIPEQLGYGNDGLSGKNVTLS